VKKLYNIQIGSGSFILFIILIILVIFTNGYSQKKPEVNHAFHDNFVFGVDGGVTFPQTDYQSNKIGLSLRGNLEYFFKTNSIHLFGLKLKFGTEQIKGEDDRGTISSQDGPRDIPPSFSTSIFSLGLAATYSISISDVFFPYISGGIANLWFDPKDDLDKPAFGNVNNLYSKNTIAYNVEAGFKVLVSDQLSINLSVNPHFPSTDYLDDVAGAYSNDAYTSFLLGFSYSPFSVSKPVEEDIKAPVVAAPVVIEGQIIKEEPKETVKLEETKTEIEIPVEEVAMVNGKYILLGDDIFSPNSAMIKVDGKEKLDPLMKQLQKFPEKKWRIEGHMDSNGSKRFLRNLSLERAKAVLDYFTHFGDLKRENFQVFGMGGNFPVGDNNTEEGRIQNRRIEIIPED